MSGNSKQKTRQGYNLLNYDTLTSKTINGITYTINDDKSITANGTATSNSILFLSNNFSLNLEKGNYVLSGCSNGSASTYYIEFTDGSKYYSCVNGNKLFNFSEDVSLSGYITVRNGATVSNVTFYPMLTKGTEEKEYEEYGASPTSPFPSPIRNTGENGSVNFKVQNKNLLDLSKIKAQEGSTQYSAGKVELLENGFKLTKITETGNGNGRFVERINLKLIPRKIYYLWKCKQKCKFIWSSNYI